MQRIVEGYCPGTVNSKTANQCVDYTPPKNGQEGTASPTLCPVGLRYAKSNAVPEVAAVPARLATPSGPARPAVAAVPAVPATLYWCSDKQ